MTEEWAAAPLEARVALLVLGVALAVSIATDLRERRILNAVTYPALLITAACVFWRCGGAGWARATSS